MRRVLSGGVELPGLREGATYNYIGAPNQLLLPLNVVDAGAGVGLQPWKAEPPTQHRLQPTYTYPTLKVPSAMRPRQFAQLLRHKERKTYSRDTIVTVCDIRPYRARSGTIRGVVTRSHS